MPTNRAGDRTATQAPSAKPEPEGTITQALPADGDPDNASTFAQAFKVVADFIDFVLKIQSKASAWAQWMFAFRTSAGHKRYLIDHLGLPMGRVQAWRESWERGGSPVVGGNLANPISLVGHPVQFNTQFRADLTNAGSALSAAGNPITSPTLTDVQAALASAGSNLSDIITSMVELKHGDRWSVLSKQTTGTSQVTIVPPDAVSSSRFRYASLSAGNTAEDYASLFSECDVTWSDDLSFAAEWEVVLQAANLSTLTAFVGFAGEGGDPPLKTVSPPMHYAGFRLIPGGGNWFAAYNGGGSPATIDTTVAATTSITRMRVEFHGANVADDGVRAVRLYIDGTLRATITTNIPGTGNRASIQFSLRNSAGGSSGLATPVAIGPVRFASNIYPADVS